MTHAREVIAIVNQSSILYLWTTSTVLSVALCAPPTLRGEAEDEQDNLTAVEESYAYSTKTPSQRVNAFLKVAENKFQQVKRNAQNTSSSDISVLFNGYSTAIKGAWMGVSWGQALKTDMTDSVRAIQKTTKKHIETLRKLQAVGTPSQREALGHILDTIIRNQKLESNDLYARR
jgi:hypothetical protein